MANQVKLQKSGNTVYPQTVSDAVAYTPSDSTTPRKLTTVIEEKLDITTAKETYVTATEVLEWQDTDDKQAISDAVTALQTTALTSEAVSDVTEYDDIADLLV